MHPTLVCVRVRVCVVQGISNHTHTPRCTIHNTCMCWRAPLLVFSDKLTKDVKKCTQFCTRIWIVNPPLRVHVFCSIFAANSCTNWPYVLEGHESSQWKLILDVVLVGARPGHDKSGQRSMWSFVNFVSDAKNGVIILTASLSYVLVPINQFKYQH